MITAELHLGVEEQFRPAEKAHPGLVLDTLIELEATAARIEHAGYQLSWAERDTYEGYVRLHARDSLGNRVEVMTPTA